MAVKNSEIIKAKSVMGPEPKPVVGEELTENKLGSIFNWYAYVYDHDHAKDYLVAWATTNNHPQLKEIKKIKASRLKWSIGWMARMLTNGFKLTDRAQNVFDDYINNIGVVANRKDDLDEIPEISNEPVHVPATPIQTLTFVLNNINKLTSPFLISTYFTENRFKKEIIQGVHDHFISLQETLKSDILKKTKKVKGYMPKLVGELALLRKKYEFASEVVKFALAAIAKPTRTVVNRKPRKSKPKSPAQLLRHFRYQRSVEGYKSIEPEKIIGAQYLYAWNTQTNTLTVFKAKNENGLSVNRTSIDNYDINLSGTKRIGRYLETALKTITEGSKPERIKVLETVKNEYTKFTDRLNENTILLRIEK